MFVLFELACFYGCNVLINEYLLLSGSPENVIDTSSRLFHLAAVYRFIYIAGLSTAFRIAINLLKTQKRNLEFVTEKLIGEKENESLRANLATAELSVLRSQVNPHFLFNSLNSLYNRTRKNDPVSAEYIMALAELMRYSLQPATDEVPLDYELEHISHYLEIQKMRLSSDIDVNIDVQDAGLKIEPMLLISIVENVFQHGELKDPRHRPIIEVRVSAGELMLLTRNHIRRENTRGNGVALDNIHKRLEYQYKDRFEFEYGAHRNIFNVKLRIKLR